MHFAVLWYLALTTVATVVSLDSQLPLLNTKRPSVSTWVLLPCVTSWEFSVGIKLWQSQVSLVVSHYSGITVLHCLMDSVLRAIVSNILCSVFVEVRKVNQISLNPSHLVLKKIGSLKYHLMKFFNFQFCLMLRSELPWLVEEWYIFFCQCYNLFASYRNDY